MSGCALSVVVGVLCGWEGVSGMCSFCGGLGRVCRVCVDVCRCGRVPVGVWMCVDGYILECDGECADFV